MEKESFFKIIDPGNHLNERTREAYRKFYLEECGQDFQALDKKLDLVFPEEEGLHQYVRLSIRKFFDLQATEKAPVPQGTSDRKEGSGSKILPMEDDFTHEPASTWGTNDDVKGK